MISCIFAVGIDDIIVDHVNGIQIVRRCLRRNASDIIRYSSQIFVIVRDTDITIIPEIPATSPFINQCNP